MTGAAPLHPAARMSGPGQAPRLSLLGHDLRAAMSDIIGGLRLIDQTGLDGQTRLQLERVRAAGEGLARLLEEGLTLLPGEDGISDSNPTLIHFPRLVYDIEMRWSGRAQERGLDFVLDVEPDLPRVLSLDRIALERILSNILSNAIKYTDRGCVRLAIRREEADIVFIVQDDGPGFSGEALERLFHFKGRPRHMSKPGAGLGLHITKEMSDRLGAVVDVANAEGGGAVVTLTLPRLAWQPPAEPASEPFHELPDLSGRRVLMAEDSRTNQAILTRMLVTMRADVVIAGDGVEAVEWLARQSFDLALIDIEMPRLSGIEVIKAIRALPGCAARMPILAVTAYVLRGNRTAIYAAGADIILAKPIVSIEPFAQAIATVLASATAADGAEAGDSPAEAEAAGEEPPIFDSERFHQLLRIAGPDGRRELLARLAADLGEAERGLVSGLSADDGAGIRGHTHVLIALAGAVGATRLQRRSEALNAAAHQRDAATREKLGRDVLQLLDQLIHRVAEEARHSGLAL